MNPLPTPAFWLHALGTLALQGTLVLAVAGLAQAWVTSPRWRRTAWLAALAGLALLLANALTGLDRRLAAALAPQPRPVAQFVVRGNLPPPSVAPLPGLGDGELGGAVAADVVFADVPVAVSPGVWWPAWVWLGGALLVGLWSALPRLWLACAWRQRPPAQPVAATGRVADLARRLGLRRSVRVLSSARLAGPIAFGVLRPSIGLPADFWTVNSAAEQDAMLAHELAHLAARDPFWLAVADTLVSLLWWHPLVWWGRRQFRAASEGAADEASLVIEDGPAVLAGCLVALASRWQRRGVLGLLGMAGFRSHLGRRVERLLGLRSGEPRPVPRLWQRLLLGFSAASTLAAAVALPYRVVPADAGSGTTLLAALGEAVTRSAAPPATPAGEPPRPAAVKSWEDPSVATGPAGHSQRTMLVTRDLPNVPGMDPGQFQVLAMDALTRRLARLGRFSRVSCEPFGDDQIQIRLTPHAAAQTEALPGLGSLDDVWPTVLRLIEQRGRLEFRPVHSESDGLLARNECPAGYEILSMTAAPGTPPRRSVVSRSAVPGLGSTNIAEAVAIRDGVHGEPRVAITFDEFGQRRFAELTRDNVGRGIAVILDGELLMAPVIREPILRGKCEISGRFSDEEAGVLAALLAYPLPGPLKRSSSMLPAEALPTEGVVSLWVDANERILWDGREVALADALAELERARAQNPGMVVRLVVVEGAGAGVLTQLLDHCKTAGITHVSLSHVKEWPPSTNGAPASPGSGVPPQSDSGSRTSVVQRVSGVPGATATLVQDARLLYELGELSEAKLKLEDALKKHPGNAAAEYYLRLVRDAESASAKLRSAPTEPTPLLHPTAPPTRLDSKSTTVGFDRSVDRAPEAKGSSAASLPGPELAAPSPAHPPEPRPQLFTRTFRVNPAQLSQGLAHLGGSGSTNASPPDALRRLLAAAGLDLAGSNALPVFSSATNATAFQGPSGRALFLNDRTGVLLARATEPELATLEQLLEVLNSSPPQVTIEAKFVEITRDDNQHAGFDWYLGSTLMGTNGQLGQITPEGTVGVFPGAPSATGAVGTLTGLMTDAQFRGVAGALQPGGTNEIRQLAGDQLDWSGRQAANAGNIRVTAAVGTSMSGILTDPQFRVVLRALEQRSGVDVLSAPRVTTLSGRQAQIQAVDLRSVLTGLSPEALSAPGAVPATNNSPFTSAATLLIPTPARPAMGATNNSPFTSAAIPVGPTLDVIPHVSADGHGVRLSVIASVTEFLGYDEPPKDAKVRVWEGGESRLVDPPLPRFRVRQMLTQAEVWDGQTLVLGGLMTEEPARDGNGKTSKDGKSLRKLLLVFVTPTLIDPAGNRIHTEEARPYVPKSAPAGVRR